MQKKCKIANSLRFIIFWEFKKSLLISDTLDLKLQAKLKIYDLDAFTVKLYFCVNLTHYK